MNGWIVILCGMLVRVRSQDLPNQMVLLGRPDAALLVLRWRANGTDVAIELEGLTKGWVAIGRSPDGRMDKSDILFAWVDAGGAVYAQDRFIVADQNTMTVNLTLDKQQNWILLAGKQNGTHTTIRAMRKLVTADPADYPLTNSFNLVYSIGDTAPDRRTGEIKMHSSRGSRVFSGFTTGTPGAINTTALSSFTAATRIEPQADSHTAPNQNTHPSPAISANHDIKALQTSHNIDHLETTSSFLDTPYDSEVTTEAADAMMEDTTTEEPFFPLATTMWTTRRNVFNAFRPVGSPPSSVQQGPGGSDHGSASSNHGTGTINQNSGMSGQNTGASTHGSSMTNHNSGMSSHDTGSASHSTGASNQGHGVASHSDGASNQGHGVASHSDGASNQGHGVASHSDGASNQGHGVASHSSPGAFVSVSRNNGNTAAVSAASGSGHSISVGGATALHTSSSPSGMTVTNAHANGSGDEPINLISVSSQGSDISGNVLGFPVSWNTDGMAMSKQRLTDTVSSVMNALEQVWSLIGQLTNNAPTTPMPHS